MMEVWNGPMRPANLKAAQWWHQLLMQGKRIPIVGGSDFHRDKGPVRFAHPTTWVYTDSPAAEDICKALSRGNSFVTSGPNGVRLDVQGACFGNVYRSDPGSLWQFEAEGGKAGMFLRLMTDRGVQAEIPFRMDGTARLEIPEEDWRFAYLTAGYKAGEYFWLRAISNPVYFEY